MTSSPDVPPADLPPLAPDAPLLIDAFCKAGGAGMGYRRAGFRVIGVDVEPQPRYPFAFVRADALAFVRAMGWMAAAIHGSPPCHDHTTLSSRAGTDGSGYLLGAFRDLLLELDLGVPWVIENVPGAPMRADVVLCGESFGLRTVRHRWFESNVRLVGMPHPLGDAHPRRHLAPTSTRKRRSCWDAGHNISVTGDVGTYVGRLAMGIDWMTGDELSQAIPPAYAEHLGRQLMSLVRPKPFHR